MSSLVQYAQMMRLFVGDFDVELNIFYEVCVTNDEAFILAYHLILEKCTTAPQSEACAPQYEAVQ